MAVAFNEQVGVATMRVAQLAELGPYVPARAWREAVGEVPVMAVYQSMKGASAVALLAAFGIAHPCLVPVEWALRLPQEDTMAHVRAKAELCGVAPVLAALEVVGAMDMFTALAREEGI